MNTQRSDLLRIRQAFATVHGNDIADLCMTLMQPVNLSHLATRDDIHALRMDSSQLRADSDFSFAELRADMNGRFAEFRADMDARFAEMRAEMDARFARMESVIDSRFTELRNEMNAKFAELRNDIAQQTAANQVWMVDRINIAQRWNIGMVVSVMGVVIAASKLL